MSSSDGASAIQGDRFATVTSDDHTGIVWIMSILCFVYSLLILGIRLEARRKNFGLDDILANTASLLASVQYILIFLATKHGLGRSYDLTSAADAEKIGMYMIASQSLLLLALGFAKCSIISLCRRLFSTNMKIHQVICGAAMGFCGIWSIASVMMMSIDCPALRIVGFRTEFCRSLIPRWMAIGIIDSVLELAIVAMAFEGLWPLQMKFSRKLKAFSTFVLRLIIIVFAALHIQSLRQTTLSDNPGVSMAKPIIYLQVELLYALFSAAIPSLNRWLRTFDTCTRSAWIQTSQLYGMKSRERSESNVPPADSDNANKRASKMSAMSKLLPNRLSAGAKSGDFVPQWLYSASAEASAHNRDPEHRDLRTATRRGSDDMIIRKDVQWQVQYEHDRSVQNQSQ